MSEPAAPSASAMPRPGPQIGSRPRDYTILVVGVLACAVSVIFIKSSETHPFWLAGIRLFVAALFLTPLVLIEARKDPSGISFRQILRSAPGGILLSAHFITWAMGARMTTAANGSLIVNLTTVVMPIVMWLMNRERINRGEILGTLVALAGVLIAVGGRAAVSPESLNGDLMCFVSMVLYCFYIAFARRNGMGRNLWLYVVPLYYISGTLCVAGALALREPLNIPLPTFSQHEVAMLLCLGLIPTVMGHSILNWCIKTMRGQVVSTVNLMQFAFAGVIAYLLYQEKPEWLFYPMCVLILIGSFIVIRSHRTSVDVDAES